MTGSFQIYYEDADIIVVRKPAGTASENSGTKSISRGYDLVTEIRSYLAKSGQTKPGQIPYVGAVHRLDQPVTGVMVYAKTKAAAAALSAQFKEHETCKEYLALVCHGEKVPEGEVTLEDTLLFDRKTNTTQVVPEGTPGGKKALLSFCGCDAKDAEAFRGSAFRKAREDTSVRMVRVTLQTGRHHQIRVQLAHAGMPIWGDNRYNPEFAGLRLGTLALCSEKLEFTHPVTGKRMTFHYSDEAGVR